MNHTAEYLGKMATAVQSYKEKYNITFTGATTLRGSYIMEFVYHLIIPRLTLTHPKWRADVLPSGSSVESLSDEDFDYMLCVRSLRMSPSDNRYRCMEAPHTTATGFVCYRLDEQLDTDLINLWKDCCLEFEGDLYLSSQKVKKEFLNELFNMASDMGISKTSFKHLTNSADTAAVLMKLLVKNFLCPPKILTSYHLKTIFFNINESLDPMFWVSDLSQPTLLGTPSRYLKAMMFLNILLENTVKCLRQCEVRHFFIRDFNLLQSISQKNLRDLLERTIGVASDPLRYLQQLEKVAPKRVKSSSTLDWGEAEMGLKCFVLPSFYKPRMRSTPSGQKICFIDSRKKVKAQKKTPGEEDDEEGLSYFILR